MAVRLHHSSRILKLFVISKFGVVEPFLVEAVNQRFLQETKHVERKPLSGVQKVGLCFKPGLWKATCNELATTDIDKFKNFFSRSQCSVQGNLLSTSESFRSKLRSTL